MRISNNQMSDGVVFNMQRALTRFMQLQTSMSSGRRINKPSDDPVGTRRDLGYRTELAKIEQYRKNIEQGQSWMKSYDSILSDLKEMVSSAKEIAVAMELSDKTVKNYLSNALDKLQVSRRSQAAAFYAQYASRLPQSPVI